MKKEKKKKPLWGLYKGLKIDEEDFERVRHPDRFIEQGHISKCQHNWIFIPDETSTYKWAGYWRCRNCGLLRY